MAVRNSDSTPVGQGVRKRTKWCLFLIHAYEFDFGLVYKEGYFEFIAGNQGGWLPSSNILHLQEGAWYGFSHTQ